MTLDTPQGRRALQYLAGLQEYGVDATARAATSRPTSSPPGELAVFFDSRRSVPAFRKAEGWPSTSGRCPRDASRPAVAAGLRRLLRDQGGQEPSSLARLRAVRRRARRAARCWPSRPHRAVAEVAAPRARPSSTRRSRRPARQVFLDVIPSLRRLPNVGPQDEAEEAANDLLAQYFAGKADLDSAVQRDRSRTAAAYEAAAARRARVDRRLRSRTSDRTAAPTAGRCAGSTSRSRPARCWPSSGRRARARRPCCALVCGLVEPTEGEVELGGRPPGAASPPERRPVAMVFQGFALFPHLTVARQHRLRAAGAAGRAGERRDRVGAGRGAAGPDAAARPAARASCPAASGSGWRWPGRWCATPRSSASTSRCRRSTRCCAPTPAASSPGCCAPTGAARCSSPTTRPRR